MLSNLSDWSTNTKRVTCDWPALEGVLTNDTAGIQIQCSTAGLAEPTTFGTFSGKDVPSQIASNGHIMRLEFQSDHSNPGKGFNISYTSVYCVCVVLIICCIYPWNPSSLWRDRCETAHSGGTWQWHDMTGVVCWERGHSPHACANPSLHNQTLY